MNNVKILVSHAHQKHEFNSQVDKMIHSVDSHSLCPVIPVIVQGSMNKAVRVAERGFIQKLDNLGIDPPS